MPTYHFVKMEMYVLEINKLKMHPTSKRGANNKKKIGKGGVKRAISYLII